METTKRGLVEELRAEGGRRMHADSTQECAGWGALLDRAAAALEAKDRALIEVLSVRDSVLCGGCEPDEIPTEAEVFAMARAALRAGGAA